MDRILLCSLLFTTTGLERLLFSCVPLGESSVRLVLSPCRSSLLLLLAEPAGTRRFSCKRFAQYIQSNQDSPDYFASKQQVGLAFPGKSWQTTCLPLLLRRRTATARFVLVAPPGCRVRDKSEHRLPLQTSTFHLYPQETVANHLQSLLPETSQSPTYPITYLGCQPVP